MRWQHNRLVAAGITDKRARFQSQQALRGVARLQQVPSPTGCSHVGYARFAMVGRPLPLCGRRAFWGCSHASASPIRQRRREWASAQHTLLLKRPELHAAHVLVPMHRELHLNERCCPQALADCTVLGLALQALAALYCGARYGLLHTRLAACPAASAGAQHVVLPQNSAV